MARKKKKTALDEYVDETGQLIMAGGGLALGSAVVGGIGGPGSDKVAGAFGTAAGFLPVVAGLSVAKLAKKTLSPKKKKSRKRKKKKR